MSDLETIDASEASRHFWAAVRRFADEAAADRGEWAGAPVPVDHVPLVMEPRYPFPGLNGCKLGEKAEAAGEPEPYVLLNVWRDYRRDRTVFVCREANGRSRGYLLPDGCGRRLGYWLNTLGVAAQHVWDVATEDRALEKLRALVTPHAFNCYRLAGMFLETSGRSGVTYLFRKLRPTLAMRPGGDGNMRVLTALCLHPLGYYDGTWAGVMCPTDDVVAHLMLMRGDEHRFWKKANHHGLSWASAGV